MYMYYGRQLDLYVGAISLIGAVVCLLETKKSKFITLTTCYPRIRSYQITLDDDSIE